MPRFLAASALLAAALYASPAAAEMKAEPLEWTVGQDRFSGWLVYDGSEDDRRPGLVMVPNWMGVTEDALERAKTIAGDDYVVLVADVYGKGRQPKDSAEAGKLAGSLRGEDRGPLRARMQAAVDTLRAQAGSAPLDADRIGALGFCFGGSAALELARSGADLAGVVSLHGGLAAGAQSATAERLRTPVLVLNGADDKAVDDAQIRAFEQEMDAAGADWQFVDFSGAVHCFAEPSAGSDPASNCRYDERAARRAYRMMEGFFDEVFGD
jgi:dienelactone hydrolase